MKISVVTINYNDSDNLIKTIKSVRNCWWQCVEFIVVDGGSSDNSIDIIKNNSDIINTYIAEKDNGIYDAMNKGIKLSTGDFIIFMNSGDCFYDDFSFEDLCIEIEAKKLNNHIIYGDNILKIGNFYKHRKLNEKDNFPCHQSVLVPRKILLETGFDTNYKICADYKLVSELLKNNDSYHYPFFIAINELGGVSNNWGELKNLIGHINELDSIDHFNKAKYTKMCVSMILKYILVKVIGYKKTYLIINGLLNDK